MMTLVQFSKAAAIGVALLALSSCQYGYNIKVLVRDGRIAFKLGDSGRVPRLDLFQVDDVGRGSHAVWRLETTETNGLELPELPYGKVPSGFRETVHAKQLEVGRVYRISLLAVDGNGTALFAISDDKKLLRVSE